MSGDVLIEIVRHGDFLRCTAIDAATATEVFVVGPVTARPEDLQRLAIAKLKRRLNSEGAGM